MSTETASVCPHCGEPLETVKAAGLYAYAQDYDLAADEWSGPQLFYESDHPAYYTCGACEKVLPAETVAGLPVPEPIPAALAIIQPMPDERPDNYTPPQPVDRLPVFAPIARALIDAAAVLAVRQTTDEAFILADAIRAAREALQLAGLWDTCPDCNGTGRDSEGERCAHQCPEIEPEPACGACEDTGRDLAGYCDCNAGDARRMRDQEDADQSAEDRSRDR